MWIWKVLQLSFDRARSTEREQSSGSTHRRAVHPIVLAAVATYLGACQGIDAAEPSATPASSAITAAGPDDHARRCDWEQWGSSPEHTGSACAEVEHFL